MATLFLTSACNLKCPYCYATENTFSADEQWTMPRIERVLDLLKTKGFRLALGGGEPLTDIPLVLETGRQATIRNIPISLLTNGYMLTPALLRDLRHAGFNWIQVSADSQKEVAHFEPLFLEGSRIGLRMAVGTVLLPQRMKDIRGMLEIMARTNITGWRILRYTPLDHNSRIQQAPSNEEWINMLLTVEAIVRSSGYCPVQIRYEPSVAPLSWLEGLSQAEKLDVCGGRRARRVFLYPDGGTYACGLPRRKGISLASFESNLEEWLQHIDHVPPDRCLFPEPDAQMQSYCRDVCRGGCVQMRGDSPCDPRCALDHGLVPVCCFEKLLIATGISGEGRLFYPSEVFESWRSNYGG
ncbi:MAG: radical SAM protein [Saprospirales bacterium]|nr:radical SAM protein [Saprospirales bacterium]